jgi:hypothetical protein
MSDTKTDQPMTLIAGMKELQLILKKMGSNAGMVLEYAAQPSNEIPLLSTGDAQTDTINRLAQSTEDLADDYAKLSARINYTNLVTCVTINGKTKSIHEWLQYRRKLIRGALSKKDGIKGGIELIYQAMSTAKAEQKINMGRMQTTQIDITRYYDEATKQEKLREWMETYERIDQTLEVVNATTPLLDIPVLNAAG